MEICPAGQMSFSATLDIQERSHIFPPLAGDLGKDQMHIVASRYSVHIEYAVVVSGNEYVGFTALILVKSSGFTKSVYRRIARSI